MSHEEGEAHNDRHSHHRGGPHRVGVDRRREEGVRGPRAEDAGVRVQCASFGLQSPCRPSLASQYPRSPNH